MRKFKVVSLNSNFIQLSKNDEYHLTKVLRCQEEDEIFCYDSGKEYRCHIFLKPVFKVKIIEEIDVEEIEPYPINLYVGIIKKQNFELLVRILNELNIKSLTPIYFNRSQKSIKLNYDRLKSIIDNSCKQCERKSRLIVNDSVDFKNLKNFEFNGINLFLTKEGNGNFFNEWDIEKELNLFIGPEGGFDDLEEKWLEKNFLPIKINDLILKTETAAIAISSALTSLIVAKQRK